MSNVEVLDFVNFLLEPAEMLALAGAIKKSLHEAFERARFTHLQSEDTFNLLLRG